MNKKLEKIELLNKQNELSLSRLDKPDNKNLYINYIKGKIKYEILDKEYIDYEYLCTIALYDFPEQFIPYIKVVSYFDTENGNRKYIESGGFGGDNIYSVRQIDKNYELHIRIIGYLMGEYYNRIKLYHTLFLWIQLP